MSVPVKDASVIATMSATPAWSPHPGSAPTMTDLQTVILATLVWLGVWWSLPVPVVLGAVTVLPALIVRSVRVLLLGAFLLANGLGANAAEGYQIMQPQSFAGIVTAVSLPDVATFGERIEVKLGSGERVSMSVSPAAGSVRSVRAGDKIAVEGTIRPIDGTDWERSRHLEGRLTARSVRRIGPGGVHWQAATALQLLVENGSASLSPKQAALYRGLVTGDDRDQGAAQKAVFRAVGLSHILAVSGQNVAFVLILLRGLLGFAPRRARPLIVATVLALFALATQMEPSVMRATVTASVGYWAVVTGRAGSGARLLSIAVATLLLIDPFLARAVGFQLSVLAVLGILLLGPAITNRMRGPAWLRFPVSVTLAAQLAVAPLLIGSFGDVSLVSLPANLLAGWAAGAVMMWGMSVGLVAGLIGDPGGSVLQSPLRVLLWWIDAVAVAMVNVPAPVITAGVGLFLLGAVVVALGLPAWIRPIVILLALATPYLAPGPDHLPLVVLKGGGVFIDGGSGDDVLLLRSSADLRVVEAVMALRPGPLLVVVEGGHRGMSVVVREIDQIAEVQQILAPPQHTVVGGVRLTGDTTVPTSLGSLTITAKSETRLTARLSDGTVLSE